VITPTEVPSGLDNDDLRLMAELDHMRDLAEPEWAYLQHWQDEHPETDMRDLFNIPGNRTSERMAMFADASQHGQRSVPYSTAAVRHLQGYFDRSMRALTDEVERCQMHKNVEEKAIKEGNDLLRDIATGGY
jgi:hypothetical protein